MKTNSEKRFLFRLARELGYTMSRLMEEMDSREIAEWIAFFMLENEEDKKPKTDPKVLGERMKASMGAYNLSMQGNKR
jgi:hypothetical protein